MPTDPAVVMDGGGLVSSTSSTGSITTTYYIFLPALVPTNPTSTSCLWDDTMKDYQKHGSL